MIVTDKKIVVTTAMMEAAGLRRGAWDFGVPVDPKDVTWGVRWKWIGKLTEDDFDTIETYFINKKNATTR